MSEYNAIHSDENPLNDELVTDFLQNNPEFFSRNLHLLTELRLADPHRGTVSLVERQQQQLRQKVHALEEEITHLMSIANQNEQLFHIYSEVYLQLLDCQTISELFETLQTATVDGLKLAECRLWLADNEGISHECIIEADCRELMESRLANEDYYFGRLQQTEQSQLFTHIESGSVVLVKLEHDGKMFGFLAFRSEDAEHFDPRMDTLLLSQFKRLVSKLLANKL